MYDVVVNMDEHRHPRVDRRRRGKVNSMGASTVRFRGMETGISEASKRVSIFSFATQGGKQASSYFRQRNWFQAREAQIWFPAGGLEFVSIE